MGRATTNIAHKHFNYDASRKISSCKTCDQKIKGNHGTNLKKHLLRFHDFNERDFDSQTVEKKSDQLKLEEVDKIQVAISKQYLIEACVELVTSNGRPFTLMKDSGFRKILDPILEGLQKKRQSLSLTPQSIQTYVNTEYNAMKLELMNQITGSLICIKVDAVTRLDRSFLGINIQYMHEDSITLQTLALKELKDRHTGEYISDIILEVCNDFGIKNEQIYTITTDNGSNMIKAIKTIASGDGDIQVIEMDEDDGDEVQEIVDNVTDECSNSSHDILNLTNLLQPRIVTGNIDPSIDTNTNSVKKLFVTGMRCAAHTLQLAVEAALRKERSVVALILKARQLIKRLRTQTFLYMIKKQHLKKPVIDCSTRWGSTLKMLESLLDLKEFCYEIAMTSTNKSDNFNNFSENEWMKISSICQALQPADACTKKLQLEQLTLSDFYGYWSQCKMDTNKINTSFSNTIVIYMDLREQELLNNNVVLAAIFLDPRYKILLDNNQREKAKSHLKELWYHLLAYKANVVPTTITESCSETDTSVANDDFEELLRQRERQVAVEKSLHSINSSANASSKSKHAQQRPIECILNNYDCEQGRINRKSNILKFWSENKNTQPELYTLAQIVLSVPATQVSVERLFSGLKFVLSPLRSNVKPKILEQQIFIRSNKNFCKNKVQPFPSDVGVAVATGNTEGPEPTAATTATNFIDSTCRKRKGQDTESKNKKQNTLHTFLRN